VSCVYTKKRTRSALTSQSSRIVYVVSNYGRYYRVKHVARLVMVFTSCGVFRYVILPLPSMTVCDGQPLPVSVCLLFCTDDCLKRSHQDETRSRAEKRAMAGERSRRDLIKQPYKIKCSPSPAGPFFETALGGIIRGPDKK
jgi:hypothetical protein